MQLALVPMPVSATSAFAPLPQYTGPKPPWSYKGYESFPSHYFGANQSGPQPAAASSRPRAGRQAPAVCELGLAGGRRRYAIIG